MGRNTIISDDLMLPLTIIQANFFRAISLKITMQNNYLPDTLQPAGTCILIYSTK